MSGVLDLLKSSLRVRLMLGTLIWISLALIVAGFLLTAFFKEYASKQLQQSLQVHMDQLTANFNVDAQATPSVSPALSDPRFSQPLSGLYWQINSEDGLVLMRSRSLWDDVIKLPPLDDNQTQEDTLTVTDREIKTVQLLVRTITPEENPNQKWTLIMAGSSRELEKSLDELAIRLSLFLVLLFVSLSIAAIAQVILSLSPLRSLQNEMKKLRTTPMIRLKGNFPQEVQPLIDEFNLALDQNEQVIARARAQTGDLAHALKTPLAVLSNAARNDLLQPNRDHKMSELVSEQVTVMQRHIDWRLKRARTATTQDARHGQIEIAPVMTQLVHVMQRIHQQRSIEILTVFSPENVSFHGEIQDLQEMLGNILDNAFKWAYSKITIQATMENKGLKIVVADDGPGLPAQQCQRVIERGFRADEQTPGSGLGLSIVQELVGLYQGRMELDLNEPEGLRITLRF